jgi:hypothetical protein
MMLTSRFILIYLRSDRNHNSAPTPTESKVGSALPPACLEPLRHRINSSNVPPDSTPLHPQTGQEVEARQLEA